MYRRIMAEEEERLEYERRQAETRRVLYEEQARRRDHIARELAR